MARQTRARQQPVRPASRPMDVFAHVSKAGVAACKDKTASPVAIDKDTVAASPCSSRKRKASTTIIDGGSTFTNGNERAIAKKKACRRTSVELQLVRNPPELLVPPRTPTTKGKRVAKCKTPVSQSAHRPSRDTAISATRRGVQTKLQVVIDNRTRREKEIKRSSNDAQTKGKLPDNLSELIGLNRSFLVTIVCHLTHSGSCAAVDTRRLAPDVTRSWGKRQVTVEDIRRCISIQGHAATAPSPYVVVDYGNGNVCVDLAPGVQQAPTIADVERLHSQFIDNLHALSTNKTSESMDIDDVPLARLSLTDIPLAPVADRSTADVKPAQPSRGQQLLQDFKRSLAAKKQLKQLATAGGQTVLDRIRLKQLTMSEGHLSPEQRVRKAALERVVDVAAVLSMMSLVGGHQARQAYSMGRVVERLRDSMRVPASAEECAACVRVLGGEVAPEWIRVVTLGGRENVVITRDCDPAERVLRERVAAKLAAM